MVNNGLKCVKVKIKTGNKNINGFIYRDDDISTKEPLCKESVLYEYEYKESEYITSIYKLLEEGKTITIKKI
jgi:hypothetical protein